RRLARDVRGHEPRHCPAQAAANYRQGLPLRAGRRGAALHGERRPLRQDLFERMSPGQSQGSGVRGQGSGVRRQGAVMAVQPAQQWTVYIRAYALAMRIYELSKQFPAEERYALTCQIRRSSRSVCTNLREAWAKRRYPAHFISKLTDCDGENGETDTSLDFARDCGYITLAEHTDLTAQGAEVGKMLGSMIQNPEGFLLTPDP